jgi:membrane associated rhomboid family serine protease
MPQAPRPRLFPPLTPVVKWILGVEVAAFLFVLFAGERAVAEAGHWLVLTPDALLGGRVWALATTVPFDQSAGFLINIFMTLMFLPQVERAFGRRRFLTLLVATALIGNLAAVGAGLLFGGAYRGTPIMGLSPFILASVVAFGLAHAEDRMRFFGAVNMTGRTFALGMGAVIVLMIVLGQQWVTGVGDIAAMVFAAFFVGGAWQRIGLWRLRLKHRWLRRKITVIDGGRPWKQRDDKKQRWMN